MQVTFTATRQERATLFLERAQQVLANEGDPAVAQAYAAASLSIQETPDARGALIAAMSRDRPRLTQMVRPANGAHECKRVALHASGAMACGLDDDVTYEIYRDAKPTKFWYFRRKFEYFALSFSPDARGLVGLGTETVTRTHGTSASHIHIEGIGSLAGVSSVISNAVGDSSHIAWLNSNQFVTALLRSESSTLAGYTTWNTDFDWEWAVPLDAGRAGKVAVSGANFFIGLGNGQVYIFNSAKPSSPCAPPISGSYHDEFFPIAASPIGGRIAYASGYSEEGNAILTVAWPKTPGTDWCTIAPMSNLHVNSMMIRLRKPRIDDIEFNNSGSTVATLDTDSIQIRLYNSLNMGEFVTTIQGKTSSADIRDRSRRVKIALSETRLHLTAGEAPHLLSFDIADVHGTNIYSTVETVGPRIAFSRHSHELLASGTTDNLIRIPLSGADREIKRVPLEKSGIISTIVSTILFDVISNSSGSLWFMPHDGGISSRIDGLRIPEEASLSPDGRWLAVGLGGGYGVLVIVNTRTRAVASTTPMFGSSIGTLRWLSANRLFLASYFAGANIVDVDERGQTRIQTGPMAFGGTAGHGAVTQDGGVYTYGSQSSGDIERVEIATGKQLPSLPGHTSWPIQVVYGVVKHHGELLASASWDKTVRIWSGSETIATLQGHDAQVWDVDFSPDGRMLASAGADGTARIWRLFLDTDNDGTDDLDLLSITGEEALQDAHDRFGLILKDFEVVYDEDWSPPSQRRN